MKTFICPSCDNPCHIDHLDYDEFGGGCPHCGYEMSLDHIELLLKGERRDADQSA